MNEGPEIRIIRLELQHAIRAIERAWLIVQGSELEGDLERSASTPALQHLIIRLTPI